MFIYLGLVFNGASWRQLLRNLDPITGTRKYSQLLKLLNERQEQRKIIKEKERVLKRVSYLKKRKRKKSCLEYKTKKKEVTS